MREKKAAPDANKTTTPLQALRIKRGLSQTQMASLMNINKRQYITLEKTQTLHKRDITQIIKLCIILNCSMSDLFADEAILADLRFLEYQSKQRSEPDYIPDEEKDFRAKPNKRFNRPT